MHGHLNSAAFKVSLHSSCHSYCWWLKGVIGQSGSCGPGPGGHEGGSEMNLVKLVLPHPIVPEQDNSPGNSLIVFNEHGWLRACFGEKEGAGNCENLENARLICKGNEVDIKHGYCLPLNIPSLISLDALFKVSLKFSKSSFCISQHRWHSILQRRIYVLCDILLNKGSYITEEVMLLCFNQYCDEKNFASNIMARDQVKNIIR